MIKKILTYGFGEVLVKGISFLAVPLYSYMILPSEYGTLGFLNALVAFLPFIFTFYYLYGYVRFSVEEKVNELISTYFFLGILLSLFYLLASIVVYLLVIQNYNIKLKYFILSILASSSIFLFQIMQMYYRSKGEARKYIKFSMLYSVAGLLLNFLFLTLFEDNVFAMLSSSLLNSLLLSIVAFYILREYIFWEYFNLKLVKKILKYTVPLVPGAIALLLFSQSDKLILVKYISKEQLGVYTMAFTLGLSMSYIGSAFFMGYQPIFYEKIASNLKLDIEKQFSKNVFLIIGALLISWFTIYIIYNFIDIKYISGLKISLLIALAYSMMTFAQMMELHLTYIKKTSIVSIIYGIGGILTVLILILLVPLYGGFGASISLCIGAFFISIFMYVFGQKYFYLNYNVLYTLFFYSSILLLSGGLYVC